jgi:magnesium chelatase family protein
LDRVDLHVDVPLVDYRELSSDAPGGESSTVIRERVRTARRLQQSRFKGRSTITNASMPPRLVREHCKLDSMGAAYLEHSMEQMNFSVRAHDRILKVARTIADLGGSETIRPDDVLEAIQYRTLDRNLFA